MQMQRSVTFSILDGKLLTKKFYYNKLANTFYSQVHFSMSQFTVDFKLDTLHFGKVINN